MFGPERWKTVAGRDWSHWDMWCCLVCVTDFGGDWSALEDAVVERHRLRTVATETWEAKRSHLLDLRARLDDVGLSPAALAGQRDADASGGKVLMAKARRKLLDQDLAERDLTPQMVDTPREGLRRRAWRGHWDGFPVSPAEEVAPFEKVFRRLSRAGYVDVFRLDALVGRLTASAAGDPARLLAVRRALLTVVAEGYHRGARDDGFLGTTVHDAVAAYLATPWRDTGIDPVVYWTDLCEWCVWDSWGMTFEQEADLFRGARRDEVETIESILVDLDAELRSHRLDHEAREARELIAWMTVATRSFDRMVDSAERLKADSWRPVAKMATVAAKRGRRELAVAIYDAAIAGGGLHVSHLTSLRDALGK